MAGAEESSSHVLVAFMGIHKLESTRLNMHQQPNLRPNPPTRTLQLYRTCTPANSNPK